MPPAQYQQHPSLGVHVDHFRDLCSAARTLFATIGADLAHLQVFARHKEHRPCVVPAHNAQRVFSVAAAARRAVSTQKERRRSLVQIREHEACRVLSRKPLVHLGRLAAPAPHFDPPPLLHCCLDAVWERRCTAVLVAITREQDQRVLGSGGGVVRFAQRLPDLRLQRLVDVVLRPVARIPLHSVARTFPLLLERRMAARAHHPPLFHPTATLHNFRQLLREDAVCRLSNVLLVLRSERLCNVAVVYKDVHTLFSTMQFDTCTATATARASTAATNSAAAATAAMFSRRHRSNPCDCVCFRHAFLVT